MEIRVGREYWRQSRPRFSSLQRGEIDRCLAAVDQFRRNPRHPGLNSERLGKGAQNHWSIRASRELRVIVAVEVEGGHPTVCGAVNMGHHDAMYAWSERQRFHTDLSDPAVVRQQDDSKALGHVGDGDARSPDDFEEWMLFLSAAQRRLVVRHHAGAARIRGAAGTGKTAIALHRAAELGKRYPDGRILVTTFSRSLCNHMAALFRRLPSAPGNVIFSNIDRVAYAVLAVPPKLDAEKADQAFAAAYERIVPGTSVERLGTDYLKDEIRRVIKGRDASREAYLDTGRFERLGRIQSFRRRDRETCWRLREAWDQELAARGISSFEDLLLAARDAARERPSPVYRSVIVDEGQDMTLVGMQLVRALVACRPDAKLLNDSVLMLDDTAQRIYAGGFRPTWAGLDFSGNSQTLRINYRNSKAIFEAARAVRGDSLVAREDNDDGTASDVTFEREDGERPTLQVSADGEAPVIRDRIRQLTGVDGLAYEEIGVLVHRNKAAEQLVAYLSSQGIPCANLRALREGPLDARVRVGTFDRAKGLEFRAVLIARLGKSRFPMELTDAGEPGQLVLQGVNAVPAGSSDEEREVRQLRLDRLYAAMTRARDYLFLFADEEPCDEIRAAYGRMRVPYRMGGF